MSNATGTNCIFKMVRNGRKCYKIKLNDRMKLNEGRFKNSFMDFYVSVYMKSAIMPFF